jgi:hypothetical protein
VVIATLTGWVLSWRGKAGTSFTLGVPAEVRNFGYTLTDELVAEASGACRKARDAYPP